MLARRRELLRRPQAAVMASFDPPNQAIVTRAVVAGTSVVPGSITVGDGWHREMPASAKAITVEIAREAAFNRFEAYYKDYVDDCRRHPPEDDEPSAAAACIERQLVNAGLPTLERLMADRPALYASLIACLAYDFLNELFRASGPLETGYAICRVDAAELRDGALVLRGLAYRF